MLVKGKGPNSAPFKSLYQYCLSGSVPAFEVSTCVAADVEGVGAETEAGASEAGGEVCLSSLGAEVGLPGAVL